MDYRKFGRVAGVVIIASIPGACDVLGIGTPTIEGEWLLHARSLRGGADECQLGDMVLTFQQTRDRFSGMASAATLTCLIGDSTRVFELPAQPIVSGKLDESTISFLIGGPEWSNIGEVTGSTSMTGIMSVRFGPPVGSSQFVGQFGAAKAPTSAARLLPARSAPVR